MITFFSWFRGFPALVNNFFWFSISKITPNIIPYCIYALLRTLSLFSRVARYVCSHFSAFVRPYLTLKSSCYGKDVIHSLICTFTQWLTFKLIGHTKFSLYFSFLFQFGYLLGEFIVWVFKQFITNKNQLDMPIPKLKDMIFVGQCRAVLCAFV